MAGFFYLLLLLLPTKSNYVSNRQLEADYSVEIIYVEQPSIRRVKYVIRPDTLSIIEYKQSKYLDSVVYKSVINKREINDYFYNIENLKFEKLDPYYEGGGYDGWDMLVKINIKSVPTITVGLHNYKHPSIISLVDETNKLIQNERLRIMW